MTDNLELNGHKPEIDELHSRPDDKVRLQRRNIDVLELLLHLPMAATLSDRHEGKEGCETARRKEQLVECDSPKGIHSPAARARTDWEPRVKKAEPAVLQWRHDERVCHESNHPLKVEGRRCLLVFMSFWPRDPLPQFSNLYREEVILTVASCLSIHMPVPLPLSPLEGCESLCDCVGDPAQHGVGDHGREDRSVLVVCIEFADEYRDHCDLDQGDYCMEERLRWIES